MEIMVYGQNGIGQNGTDKWYGQNGIGQNGRVPNGTDKIINQSIPLPLTMRYFSAIPLLLSLFQVFPVCLSLIGLYGTYGTFGD